MSGTFCTRPKIANPSSQSAKDRPVAIRISKRTPRFYGSIREKKPLFPISFLATLSHFGYLDYVVDSAGEAPVIFGLKDPWENEPTCTTLAS